MPKINVPKINVPKINVDEARKKASGLLKRLIPQILVQSFAIIGTATGSYMFMTWIVQDLAHVESTYVGAAYEVLGTLVLVILVLVSTNTYIYRKRLQEINTLSAAISRVAGGDFEYKIKIRPNEPMATVYEDFNKMSAELSSVQILRNDFINSYSHEFKTPSPPSMALPRCCWKENCPKRNSTNIWRSFVMNRSG